MVCNIIQIIGLAVAVSIMGSSTLSGYELTSFNLLETSCNATRISVLNLNVNVISPWSSLAEDSYFSKLFKLLSASSCSSIISRSIS